MNEFIIEVINEYQCRFLEGSEGWRKCDEAIEFVRALSIEIPAPNSDSKYTLCTAVNPCGIKGCQSCGVRIK